jgi:hypothetical protein
VIQFGHHSTIDWTGAERPGKGYYCKWEPPVIFLVKSSFQAHSGTIHNVTNEGVTLAFPHRLPEGSQLAILMPTTDPLLPEFRLAEICHCFLSRVGWLMGCRFLTRIPSAELRAWAQRLPFPKKAKADSR